MEQERKLRYRSISFGVLQLQPLTELTLLLHTFRKENAT